MLLVLISSLSIYIFLVANVNEIVNKNNKDNDNNNDNGEFYQQLQGTAIGTKFAPSYAIPFMAALKENLLSEAPYKPWLWWRFIDDIFLIWRHYYKTSTLVH